MGASLILIVQMGRLRHWEPKYLVNLRSSWIPPVLFSSSGITFLLVKDKSGPKAEEIKDADLGRKKYTYYQKNKTENRGSISEQKKLVRFSEKEFKNGYKEAKKEPP